MKTSHVLFLAASATALAIGVPSLLSSKAAAAPAGVVEAAKSEKAPDWKVSDLAGKPLSSADLKGKVVVVDFWATWCGPCVSEIPGYVQLQKKYDEKGLKIVGLSVDQAGPEVVKKFVQAKKINYAIAMADDDVIKAFGSFDAIPTTFVIDREGRIRFKKTGSLPEEEFEAVLKELL
ncbi:hypothetical protein DB347_03320 [Opitutaceae bacterium EW11]|nr:hypothetical protein DB347_03320 [Opitutaceae bacterium EW11]